MTAVDHPQLVRGIVLADPKREPRAAVRAAVAAIGAGRQDRVALRRTNGAACRGESVYPARDRERHMHFLRLWAISALAALCAMLVVLAAWLFAHVGFDADEALDAISGYGTNARLVGLLVVISVLIGLVEAAILQFWSRRRRRRT
jgi:hypothetical protein